MQEEFALSGQIVDVVAGTIYGGRITISGGMIHSVERDPSISGPYLLPGLVDAHIHIESSMLVPSEFARLAVMHGTVATVSDPHEIANVLGMEGIEFMVRNGKQVPFHFYFGAPSCVPATGFESAGSVIDSSLIEELLSRPDIWYLSEMMNFPGVVYKDAEVHAKLALAKKYGKPVDGHAPGLRAEALAAYASAGISTDHECTTLEEALEKIALGMHILVREGSAARNFDILVPLLKIHPEKVMFCSDDKHPDDLVLGHLNLLLNRAVSLGYDPITAIRCCTLNPVKHYSLDCGLLQAGDSADIVVMDSLSEFNVLETYVKGTLVARKKHSWIQAGSSQHPNKFELQGIKSEDLLVPYPGGKLKVIEAYDGDLLTGKLILEPRIVNGFAESDIERDILKIAVINRYQPSKPALGFIRGIGLKKGAIASTVAHDSHNLICVGTSDEEMCSAIQLLIGCKGGISVTDGDLKEVLPLPVAGIMTDQDGFETARKYEIINRLVKSNGSSLRAPFMTVAFMALLVIPELKLSDKGLFDGSSFSFTNLFELQ